MINHILEIIIRKVFGVSSKVLFLESFHDIVDVHAVDLCIIHDASDIVDDERHLVFVFILTF